MRNTKELKPLIASIYCLNQASKEKNEEIAKICKYILQQVFDDNGNMLILATIGKNYEEVKEEIKEVLKYYTKYKD